MVLLAAHAWPSIFKEQQWVIRHVCVLPSRRHVVLPKQLSKLVPTSHLMTEEEWRGLGVQQSQGWIHYMIHKPGSRGRWSLSQLI
uniref:Cyclin-dependent kinases regulatory subunit n=1 Tax=Acanthochromis polyacanthus TaxID=80966 RepID=A0A3Q1EYQ3_9TELE